MRFAGVDGCHAGWIIADTEGAFTLARSFEEMATLTADAASVLVDIPMGLAGERACERVARSLLGARRSSIFTPPVRAAVYAPDYRAACAAHQAVTGKKISQQSWHIASKIAQADQFLRADPARQQKYRESHPEVAFAALNGWQPMAWPKKTSEGRAERLACLERYLPGATAAVMTARSRYRRADVAPDDLADALCLAVAARLAWANGFPAIPNHPQYDDAGLRMEIICGLPAPIAE